MKKIILCIFVLFLASPIFAEVYDLSEVYTPTRKDWLVTRLHSVAYDIEINSAAQVSYMIENNEILGNIFLYDTDNWTYEKVRVLRERVLSDANFILKQYYWAKDIPVTAKVAYPKEAREKYELNR